ncbi:hypothetical protein D0851_04450 [Marinobacter sp. Arc7-DN-1]|nr:hypothetical protein D0851_04450 [Marinobacter sp. Arc7-DN-1]
MDMRQPAPELKQMDLEEQGEVLELPEKRGKSIETISLRELSLIIQYHQKQKPIESFKMQGGQSSHFTMFLQLVALAIDRSRAPLPPIIFVVWLMLTQVGIPLQRRPGGMLTHSCHTRNIPPSLKTTSLCTHA